MNNINIFYIKFLEKKRRKVSKLGFCMKMSKRVGHTKPLCSLVQNDADTKVGLNISHLHWMNLGVRIGHPTADKIDRKNIFTKKNVGVQNWLRKLLFG